MINVGMIVCTCVCLYLTWSCSLVSDNLNRNLQRDLSQLSFALGVPRLTYHQCVFLVTANKTIIKPEGPNTIPSYIVDLLLVLLIITISIFITTYPLQWRHMTSQITTDSTVGSTVYSCLYQRKYQSFAFLIISEGIHRWPMGSSHKGPVRWKAFLCHYTITITYRYQIILEHWSTIIASMGNGAIDVKLWNKLIVKIGPNIMWFVMPLKCIDFNRSNPLCYNILPTNLVRSHPRLKLNFHPANKRVPRYHILVLSQYKDTVLPV